MRRFYVVKDEFRKTEGEIILPTRADRGSAGYDIYLPLDVEIGPAESKIIPTDIKVQMLTDEMLLMFIRSSIDIKKHIAITNGTGVVDSTFFENPENDGNISIALTNFGSEPQCFKKGERIAQGVFVKYLVTDDDKPLSQIRNGGIGSSGV